MMNYPQTRLEAEKVRYNRWAGNPKGNQYCPSQCAYEAYRNDRSGMFYQCTRKPIAGPDNLYCKRHAKQVPVATPRGGE